MKTKVFMIAFVAISLVMQSCVTTQKAAPPKKVLLTQLTEKIIKDYQLTNERLIKIQYFNGPQGDSIVLKKSNFGKNDTISDGILKIRSCQNIDLIKIMPYTKGKMVGFSAKMIKIAFENDSLSLIFGPNEKGNYVLFGLNGENKVIYGKITYEVISGGSGSSGLFFDLDQLNQLKINKRIATGISVSEQ